MNPCKIECFYDRIKVSTDSSWERNHWNAGIN